MTAQQLLVVVWDTPWVRVILVLLAANIVTGIAESLYRGQFAIGALADWLLTRALPYILGDTVMQLVIIFGGVGDSIGLTTLLSGGVHAFVVASLAGKVLSNLSAIFPGLPIPGALTDRPKQEPPTAIAT